ncbi:MAG: hypothetical protein ACK49N_01950 [Verrucomicrobiota bacterium]
MKRHTPSWLANAFFYEVYPQSFLDTNGIDHARIVEVRAYE